MTRRLIALLLVVGCAATPRLAPPAGGVVSTRAQSRPASQAEGLSPCSSDLVVHAPDDAGPAEVAPAEVALPETEPEGTGARSENAGAGHSAVAAGGSRIRWVGDLERLRALFAAGPAFDEVEDLFRVRLTLQGASWTVDSHLLGDALRIVPYDNGGAASDAAGTVFGPGDAVIAELFPPGEVGLAIKHHRAAQRALELPYRSMFLLREELKLQGSHLQMVVGVEREGKPGAVTLSSPQTYESGRFGSPSYPMIFLRPVYPPYLDAEQTRAFLDNTRTMMVGFSSVASFPSSYASGDPMAASTPEAVREHVAMMVRAIGGDSAALRWFAEPARRLYCGELALLAINGGLLVPLNARSLVPVVGPEAWNAFVDQVERHRRGELSRFSTLNQNRLVPLIEVALAPEDLRPAPELSPVPPSTELAFDSQTAADLLRVYLRLVLPAMDGAVAAEAKPTVERAQSGGAPDAPAPDEKGAAAGAPVDVPALRSELIRSLSTGLVQVLDLGRRPPGDPERSRTEELIERIAVAAGAPGSGAEVMRSLEPMLDELEEHLLALDSSASVLLAPPSLFQAVAQDLWPAGLLDLEYVGHGLHVSLVRPEKD